MTSTADFAVKFGRQPDMGLEGQKAFPFIYTFINRNDCKWAGPYNLSNQAEAIANIVNGIGPLVPAGNHVTVNVLLDPDYNFKLLTIRYSAVYWRHDIRLTDQYQWFFDQNVTPGVGGVSDGVDPGMDQIGTPVHKYISMSLSFQGSGSQMLYGGDNTGPLGNGRLPIPVEVLEGYPDYGMLSVRTPRLLPRQGIMTFDIYNTHPTQDIVVGALIYGMKVRL
jgi:hypothetical protein